MAAPGYGLGAAEVEVDGITKGRGQLARLHEGLRVVGAELEAREGDAWVRVHVNGRSGEEWGRR